LARKEREKRNFQTKKGKGQNKNYSNCGKPEKMTKKEKEEKKRENEEQQKTRQKEIGGQNT